MKRTAIVILNWNGRKMLSTYLPSVLRYSAEADVYVVDNASTDDSLQLLDRDFKEVRTIVLDKNWGFADGYNKGLKAVDDYCAERGEDAPEYYMLLNSDIDVEEGWLAPLITFMDENKQVAACQPKLLSAFDHTMFEYAGAAGGYLDKYGYPFCRGRVFGKVEKDNGQYDKAVPVLWATGAALFIRRNDYWLAGALDGRFFAHNEEIDLCWRLRIIGREVWCVPQSRAYHVGGGTLPQGNPRKTYLNFRNNLTMLYKNLPDSQLNSVMRVRTLLDYIAALQLLMKGDFGGFKAVFRARRDYKAWRSDFDADRRRIQALRKTKDAPELYQHSILLEHYLHL